MTHGMNPIRVSEPPQGVKTSRGQQSIIPLRHPSPSLALEKPQRRNEIRVPLDILQQRGGVEAVVAGSGW